MSPSGISLTELFGEHRLKFFFPNYSTGWLRHYAASRKVAGSSPDEVDILNLPNPSGRTMALGSTQPLTEMSTRYL
jgi:hypothetical protein